MDQVQFYKKQISLTEWLEGIGHKQTAAFRTEDFSKYDRLAVLHDTIGLPYGQPRQFPATDVTTKAPGFEQYLGEHGDELCMIRVVPKDPLNPKLRMRGKTVREAVEWFATQNVDPAAYDVYFVPHTEDHGWATIFVVSEHGIFGEAIQGEHNKLTQGLYQDGERPVAFSCDFTHWNLTPANPDASHYLRDLMAWLKVEDPAVQKRLTAELGAKFSYNYLCGYFETTSSRALGTWFLDYNRILGEMYADFTGPQSAATSQALVQGQVGNLGRVVGAVRIVAPENLATADLAPGEILVCRMTTPDYLPLMQRAGAIVTDLGGILSHAAIVARELGKPCITATTNATTKLQDGQLVEVDANAGVVRPA